MASFFGRLPASIRMVDAGAGAGALTEAVVRRACEADSGVKEIASTLFEIDRAILPALRRTLARCETLCSERGISWNATIHETDFIQTMGRKLSGDFFSETPPSFNLAIVNPPYKKISAHSTERLALRSVGLETSNLYTGFVALLARLLEAGGEMVAITPRSFCNGPYFKPFREDFLSRMSLRRLHVFESRKATFKADAVLQENVIFHAIKGGRKQATIAISSSSGEAGEAIISKKIPASEIIRPADADCFIHIPCDAGHANAKNFLSGLPATLASLGVNVSTGRVVDFRLKESLRSMVENGAVPLLYPCHFNGGTVHWPKAEARKPNAIMDNEKTRPWLIPSGLYLLTKRFTSKEERRRLVACLLDPADVGNAWIGIENHLNYFHANGRGLERRLALGLFVYLNSTVVDQYFRCFSGHTQVNATDLRSLAYPSKATLQAMGAALKNPAASQLELDQIVEMKLHASQE